MSIEAMKQALEALEFASSQYHYRCQETVTSLRQAIEQAEKQKPVTYQYQNKEGNWCPFLNDKHYADTLKDGTWPIRSLYTTPQPQQAEKQGQWGASSVTKPEYVAEQKEKTQRALDLMAENARELGLDYEPTEIPIEETLKRAYYFDEHGKWRGSDVSEWQRWHGVAKAAKQAEKQEPVALKNGECWPEYVMEEWDYWRKQIADGDKGSAPRDWFEELAELKLVTAQPQREWVGLTDEEREQATGWSVGHIEQTLKEKNT